MRANIYHQIALLNRALVPGAGRYSRETDRPNPDANEQTMKLSLSTYFDSREGDYACRLTLAEGEHLFVDTTQFFCPDLFAQTISSFAQRVATLNDGSSEKALLEITRSKFGDEVGNRCADETRASLNVVCKETPGMAALNVSEESMSHMLYDQGALTFVETLKSTFFSFEISLATINQMGASLLATSKEQEFRFSFDLDEPTSLVIPPK